VEGRGHEGERTGRRGGEEGSSSFALGGKKSAPMLILNSHHPTDATNCLVAQRGVWALVKTPSSKNTISFLPHDAVLARHMLSSCVRLSVRPSQAGVVCSRQDRLSWGLLFGM